MAKKTNSDKVEKNTNSSNKIRQYKFIVGSFLVLFSIALLVSFISYFFTGNQDQSQLNSITNRSIKVENLLGIFGAEISEFFIYNGFGVASFLFVKMIAMIGIYFILDLSILKLKKTFFLGFIHHHNFISNFWFLLGSISKPFWCYRIRNQPVCYSIRWKNWFFLTLIFYCCSIFDIQIKNISR